MKKTSSWLAALLAITLLCGAVGFSGAAVAEEEMRVYLNLADAQIDLEALLAEVPTAAELGADLSDSNAAYPYESGIGSDARVSFDSNGRVSWLSMTGGEDLPFDRLTYWFTCATEEPFIDRELLIYTKGNIEARYNRHGWLTMYAYMAAPNLQASFDVYGDQMDPDNEMLSAFKPLELVGDLEESLQTSLMPNMRVYATLEDAGINIEDYADAGITALTRFDFKEADPEGYYALIVSPETNEVILIGPDCSAAYLANGYLDHYTYDALDGKTISFAPDGSWNRIYGRNESRVDQYKPLEIIRSASAESLAPKFTIYATLDAAGIDYKPVLALFPENIDLTIQDGIVTVPDEGYLAVNLYVFADSEDCYGELADGMWTLDCSAMDLESEGYALTLDAEVESNGEMLTCSSEYYHEIYLGETYDDILVDVFLPEGSDDGYSMLYINKDIINLAGTYGGGNYDYDGNLISYYYNAYDSTYVTYSASGTLIDAFNEQNPNAPVDPSLYPPLEITGE